LITDFSDTDCAGLLTDRRSITDYCVFVDGNLVSWKSKNKMWFQDPVPSLNIEL